MAVINKVTLPSEDLYDVQTLSIPFGQVDSTSTSTAFTATIPGITSLYDGVCVYLKNGVITSASGWTLNINDLGAKPVYQTQAAASRTTTIFNVAYTALFVYNSSRVDGGCWDYFSSIDLSNYLAKDNTTAFTPTGDYHPATKKYVDDATSGITSNLSGLTDTTITSPTNGQVLMYNSTTSKWENQDSNFVVTITDSGSGDNITYTADKTFAEITAAYEAGKKVIAYWSSGMGYYTFDGNYSFSCVRVIDSNSFMHQSFIYNDISNDSYALTLNTGTLYSTNYINSFNLNLSNNVIQFRVGNTTVSSITLPIYNGGVSS